MDILGVSSTLELQQQIAKQDTEKTGEDFKEILAKASESGEDAELKEACQEIEAYMLTQIFKQMRDVYTTGEGLCEKGDYESTFEDYLLEERCTQMAKQGGIGLADSMYRQMTASYSSQQQNTVAEIAQSSTIDEAL